MPVVPRYICIICGRGFTTARSGRRHVQTVESGKGYLATESEYRIKILTGKIPMPIARTPAKSFHQKKTLLEVQDEEFTRGYYYRMGEMAYEDTRSESETINLKKMIYFRMMRRLAKESFDPT